MCQKWVSLICDYGGMNEKQKEENKRDLGALWKIKVHSKNASVEQK